MSPLRRLWSAIPKDTRCAFNNDFVSAQGMDLCSSQNFRFSLQILRWVARGARHWSAEGATGGARVSTGGEACQMVESRVCARSALLERHRRDGRSVRRARWQRCGVSGEARSALPKILETDVSSPWQTEHVSFQGPLRRLRGYLEGRGPRGGSGERST